MNYRLIESYYIAYPVSAQVPTEFACYYTIDYTYTGRNYLTVDVLEDWTLKTKPIAISAAMKLPLDATKTKEQNAKPDDRWLLVFQNQDAVTIGAWKAKTPKQQAEYLGEEYVDPETLSEADNEPDRKAAADLSPKTTLQKLFGSTASNSKKNWLWIVLATVITATVGVLVWSYRRYRRTKKKAQIAAMKYGRYSRDVVDVLT